MSAALETLARFAAKQASTHEVLRALVTHDAWFVPIGFAPALGRSMFERIVQLSPAGGPPPGELYLFTDEACLDLVAKQPLGNFVTPVTGRELFCALPDELVKLKVNPGGPLEHFWFVGHEAIPLARLWGRAVSLEAKLTDATLPRAQLAEALRTFEAFTLLVHPTGAVATAPRAGGFQNPAMIFTSPDSFERVLAVAPGTSPIHLSGRELFELLPRAGVDGLVFNPMGPGQQAALPLDVTVSVLQLS
ncbi:MAG: hypothetical protein ACOZQL_35860 [Myxococcota bacterium]